MRYQLEPTQTIAHLWINRTEDFFGTNADATKTVGAISEIDHVVISMERWGNGTMEIDELSLDCNAPDGGCSTVGLMCDDGNACTINDVFDSDCNASIVCFSNIDNQGWQSICEVDLLAGQSVTFGLSTDPIFFSGSWSWTGPNGFSATTREITVSEEGQYEVTFIIGGCTYTEIMNVTVGCSDLIVETLNDEVTVSKSARIGIESNGVIPANAVVDFHAGEFILLQSGFEVKTTGIFHAYIEACE